MQMLFGKWRGYPLDQVPDDYLRWLSGLGLREPMASAVRKEIERRGGTFDNVNSLPRPALIESARRVMAKRFHPDVGGSTAAMQAVNATCDWLQERANEG